MFVKIEVEECAEYTGRGRDPCPILGCSQPWLHVAWTRGAVKLRTPRPPPPRGGFIGLGRGRAGALKAAR